MTCVSKAIERRDRKWGACSPSALVEPAFATTAAWSFPVNHRLRGRSLLMLLEEGDEEGRVARCLTMHSLCCL